MTNIPLADKERARTEQRRPHSAPAEPTGDAAPESGNGKQPGGDQFATFTWGDPDFALLDDRRGDLPEFPNTAFHGLCRQWVEGAAHAAGVQLRRMSPCRCLASHPVLSAPHAV